jgi:hypothetical protein
MEGIDRIAIEDIRAAADHGLSHQASGRGPDARAAGWNSACSPALCPIPRPLGQLQGGTNMVVIEGDAVGQIVLRGPGAGEGPTASAVMGDVCDLARGLSLPVFGQPAARWRRRRARVRELPAPWYLRMGLLDKPGRAGQGGGDGQCGRVDRPDAPIWPCRHQRAGADRHPQDNARSDHRRRDRRAMGEPVALMS